MADEDRERGRDAEIQKRIRELRAEIDQMQTTEQMRQVYGVFNQILSILSSENGTHARMLDRMDKMTENQSQITETQTKVNKLIFGNGDAEEESMLDLMKSVKKLTGIVRKVIVTLLISLVLFAAKSWYEGVKTNAIIAAQKDAATKTVKQP
jgi:hypothetical protein